MGPSRRDYQHPQRAAEPPIHAIRSTADQGRRCVVAAVPNSEIRIANGLHLVAVSAEEYEPVMLFIDHSREPNVGFAGNIVLVAMREVIAGEELTTDYALFDDYHGLMTCRCNSAACRRVIDWHDWRRRDLRSASFANLTPPHEQHPGSRLRWTRLRPQLTVFASLQGVGSGVLRISAGLGMSSAVRRLTQGALAPNPHTSVINCTSGHDDHFTCFVFQQRRKFLPSPPNGPPPRFLRGVAGPNRPGVVDEVC
jgi:hypothetical protein